MKLSELLNEELIHCKIKVENKEELLERMARKMHESEYVKEEYIEGVLAREHLNPTGLQLDQFGCAIPHSEMHYVKKPLISVATIQQPIAFNRMDTPEKTVEVQLVFMLAVNEGLKQVSVLQNLTGLIQDQNVMTDLINAENPTEIARIIKNYEEESQK